MSMDIADSAAASVSATAEAAAPDPASTPLLRTLGDADACTDGFCAVPAAEAATQPEAGTQTGADK